MTVRDWGGKANVVINSETGAVIRVKGDCPVGTVATIGHPANKTLMVKGESGWRYVETGELVDYDSLHKSAWDIVTMPVESEPSTDR